MGGFLWFIIPLLFVGKWSIALSRARRNPMYGIGLFVVTAAIIVPLWIVAENNAQSLQEQKLYTAASMTRAAGFAECGAVLLVCYFVHWFLWPKDNADPSHDRPKRRWWDRIVDLPILGTGAGYVSPRDISIGLLAVAIVVAVTWLAIRFLG